MEKPSWSSNRNEKHKHKVKLCHMLQFSPLQSNIILLLGSWTPFPFLGVISMFPVCKEKSKLLIKPSYVRHKKQYLWHLSRRIFHAGAHFLQWSTDVMLKYTASHKVSCYVDGGHTLAFFFIFSNLLTLNFAEFNKQHFPVIASMSQPRPKALLFCFLMSFQKHE